MNLTKDGLHIHNGYIYIKCLNHPRTNKDGYVKRAVLNLENIMGRCLDKLEDVHHIDGDKTNDNPNNLVALSRKAHRQLHHPKKIIEPHARKIRTHCKHGHEFTESNTYIWISPFGVKMRQCKTCNRINKRNVYWKNLPSIKTKK